MSDRLIVLQAYGNPQEAEFARGLLESHGIDVFLADEHVARMGTYMPIGGVKLQVREDDLNEAREILQGALSGSLMADEDILAEASGEIWEETPLDSDTTAEESPAEPACPICGGQRSESVVDPARSLLGVLLFGIPFLIWRGKRRCQICGNVLARIGLIRQESWRFWRIRGRTEFLSYSSPRITQVICRGGPGSNSRAFTRVSF